MIVASLMEFAGLGMVAVFVGYVLDPSTIANQELVRTGLELIGFDLESINYIDVGLVAAVMLTVGVGVNFCMQVWIVGYGARLARFLTRTGIKGVMHAPVSWHLTQNSTEVSQGLLQDATYIGNTVFPAILEFIYAVVIIGVAIIMVINTSSTVGLVFMSCCGIFSFIAVRAVRGRVQALSGKLRRLVQVVSRLGAEAFSGAKEIKIKNREESYVNQYMESFSRANNYRFLINVWFRVVPTFFTLFGQVGMVGIVLILFAYDLPRSEILQQVAFLAIIVSRLLPSITRITSTVSNIATGMPYLEGYCRQVQELKEISIEKNTDESGNKFNSWRWLSVDGVSFSYGEGRKVLRNVSLMMERGKSYAFVGRSGSGKSTLIDIIMGLQVPDTGKIMIDGNDLFANNRDWLSRIGYVAQFPFLADDTVRANVALGVSPGDVDDLKVWNCLKAAGLDDVVRSLPEALGAIVGDKGVKFSGGQRQRLAIARALYDDPEILVLDEATSALDVLTEKAIGDTIRSFSGRLTTVTIAHRLTTVAECDCLYLMDEGQLMASGDFNFLKKKSPLFLSMVQEANGEFSFQEGEEA